MLVKAKGYGVLGVVSCILLQVKMDKKYPGGDEHMDRTYASDLTMRWYCYQCDRAAKISPAHLFFS